MTPRRSLAKSKNEKGPNDSSKFALEQENASEDEYEIGPIAPEAEDDEDGEHYDGEATKDDVELKLEKLVFGDREGFRDGVRDFSWGGDVAFDEDEAGEDEGGLEQVADADVRFEETNIESKICRCRL
jgi:U3 small nucleolar RNA-associated protein 18